jgi:hypothetical protein
MAKRTDGQPDGNNGELEKVAPAEIVKKPEGASKEIAIFRHPNQKMMIQTLKDTFGKGKGINLFRDLERVKNPTSGSNTFRVQSADGEKRLEKLVGIIVAWRNARVFFDKPFGSGPVGPPACSSNDGIIGHGDPGGECASCRYAQFGSKAMLDAGRTTWSTSGPKMSGPTACRQMLQIVFLRDGIMPEVINVTPGSLNQAGPYIRRLMNYGKLPYTVLTEISLASERSGGGIEYSQLRFKMLQEPALTDEQMEVGTEYYNIFQPALHTIDLSQSDYSSQGREREQEQEQAPF